MDISPLTAPKAVATIAAVAPIPQPVDTKVPTIAAMDRSAVATDRKPFIAPIVNAKLAGTEFSENGSSAQATERVLRPYGVPMLPYDDEEAPTRPAAANLATDSVQDDITKTPALPKSA